MTDRIHDMLKTTILINLLHQMPPSLRERMLHEVLGILGYKLSPRELEELHEWTNPPFFGSFGMESFGRNIPPPPDMPHLKDCQCTLCRDKREQGR